MRAVWLVFLLPLLLVCGSAAVDQSSPDKKKTTAPDKSADKVKKVNEKPAARPDLFPDESRRFVPLPRWRRWLGQRDRLVVRPFDPARRAIGKDVPTSAETMIGRARLDNLHRCIVDVLRDEIPGDLIETGVWRGGATIFMRAIVRAYGDTQRRVWVADSFRGLPRPDVEKYPADRGYDMSVWSSLAVSAEEVRENFRRFGLLDYRVVFLEGWFADTLPVAPIDRLAVLRLDGDLYQSTMDGLVHLYPKLSPGGFAIVDDYYSAPLHCPF